MLNRPLVILSSSLILAATSLGCTTVNLPPTSTATAPATVHAGGTVSKASTPTAASTSTSSATPPEPRHVYRLDFVITSSDASNKPLSSSSYSLGLEEENGGDVHVGANVPLTVPGSTGGAAPRQDVGLLLRCHYTVVGEDLVLHHTMEMSNFDDPPAIRKLSFHGDALVAKGKPTPIASVEDPINHKHWQVTVSATKLR